jgi:hypothetical protein
MSYVVQTGGYYHCPEFRDLGEARTLLKEIVADALVAARRKSPEATRRKLCTDSYEITLGRSCRSALWNRYHIIQT